MFVCSPFDDSAHLCSAREIYNPLWLGGLSPSLITVRNILWPINVSLLIEINVLTHRYILLYFPELLNESVVIQILKCHLYQPFAC